MLAPAKSIQIASATKCRVERVACRPSQLLSTLAERAPRWTGGPVRVQPGRLCMLKHNSVLRINYACNGCFARLKDKPDTQHYMHTGGLAKQCFAVRIAHATDGGIDGVTVR